jgi:hypothetical protein
MVIGNAVTVSETTLYVGIVVGRATKTYLFTGLSAGLGPTTSEIGSAIWVLLSTLATMEALALFGNP